jgi:hypothetical protein
MEEGSIRASISGKGKAIEDSSSEVEVLTAGPLVGSAAGTLGLPQLINKKLIIRTVKKADRRWALRIGLY